MFDNADDDVDATLEIFQVLEDYGAPGQNGWAPLRNAARAYGEFVMRDSLRRGLLDPEDAQVVFGHVLGDEYPEIRLRLQATWLKAQHLEPSTVKSCHESEAETLGTMLIESFRRLDDDVSSSTIEQERLDIIMTCKTASASILECHEARETLSGALWRLATPISESVHSVAMLTASSLVEHVLLCCCGVNPTSSDQLHCARDKFQSQDVYRCVAYDPAKCTIAQCHPDSGLSSITDTTAADICTWVLFKAYAQSSETELLSTLHAAALGIMRAFTNLEFLDACRASGKTVPAALVLVTEVALELRARNPYQPNLGDVSIQLRSLFINQLLRGRPETIELGISTIDSVIIAAVSRIEQQADGGGFPMVKAVCDSLASYGPAVATLYRARTIIRLLPLAISRAWAKQIPDASHDEYANNIESAMSAQYLKE